MFLTRALLFTILLSSGAAPSLSTPALAQGPHKPGSGTPPGSPNAGSAQPVAAPAGGNVREFRKQNREHLRQEVMDQMRAMRMWKLTEELKLDEATAAKVYPLLARVDEQERELGRARNEIMRGLREQVAAATPDAGRINTLVDQLMSNRGRRLAVEQERISGLRKVLSPVQQAKLMLLMPKIEEEFRQRIRESVNRANREMRGRPLPGPGGPPKL